LKVSFKDGKHVSNGYKESTTTIGSSRKLYAKWTIYVGKTFAIRNLNLNTKFKFVFIAHIGMSCKIPQCQNVAFTLTKILLYVPSMIRGD
jgi:hypothetical protein